MLISRVILLSLSFHVILFGCRIKTWLQFSVDFTLYYKTDFFMDGVSISKQNTVIKCMIANSVFFKFS
jgi:hypothetical protein